MSRLARRRFLSLAGGATAGSVLATSGAYAGPSEAGPSESVAAVPSTGTPEPNLTIARSWWAPQRQEWTPIGWKGHLFRFNVFYNGMLMCEPGPAWSTKDNVMKYQGQGMQLQFLPPDFHGGFPAPVTQKRYMWQDDLGIGEQGWWQETAAPVLWTRWRLPQGVIVRQSVFGHLGGGGDYERETDPLYAWVRLEIESVDPLRAPQKLPFVVRMSRRHVFFRDGYADENGVTLEYDPVQAALPGRMRLAPIYNPGGQPREVRIQHLDNTIRLGTALLRPDQATFEETPAERVYDLKLTLDVQSGSHIDLLVAMRPQARAEFDRELALGWDGALAEANAYWSATADKGATIHTPEPYINEALRRFVELTEIVGEKSPETGDHTLLTGSFGYDVLWATPTSMVFHMLLDPLGRHGIARKHLRLFKSTQGTRKPPGSAYQLHPGYLGSPAHLRAFDWLSDHGAILQSIANHALLSGDKAFIDEWLDVIVKACDFVKDSCENTDHDGVHGLMPKAVATDELLETQGIWSQAWCYKGLATAVRLLRRVEHPRASELDAARKAFKDALVKAYRELMKGAPTWRHPDGSAQPVPKADFTDRPFHIFQDAFLLDGGPLFFVWAGVFDADDPLMRSHLDFFRVGPNTQLWDVRSNPIHRAVLLHEVSSCEPCYSWNLSHTWRAGDRPRFLEGLYSLAVAGLSPQTFVSNEHRHGMQGQLSTSALVTWHLLKAVVDDALKDDELHLLRLCPLPWLSEREETVFDGIPTQYGPADLRFRLGRKGRTLDVTFRAKWRWRTRPRVLLHVPPLPGLKTINVNGHARTASPGSTIVL
ncbi:hypothetical protein [Nonomuraea basaltis]|uniref:hypothetical protein n=1 Tax=Nonomuraea basaltis TaxID=2495887 RepID=UPI00110C517B|nr:hypothetical protein [Nonomuraea basaltis]TMR96571.1 hypothetical protein EJK15_22685 [Nonomuraea basaltis]